MSLRYLLKTSSLLIVGGVVLGVSASYAHAGSTRPSVETFVDDVLPVEKPQARTYKGEPLEAGALTMEDVLKANPSKDETEKKEKTPTSGILLSRGMKAVLQKFDTPPQTRRPARRRAAPAPLPAPATTLDAQMPAATLVEATPTPINTEETTAPAKEVAATPSTTATGAPEELVYVPGREPKTFGFTSSDQPQTTASAKTSSGEDCVKNVVKWEKTCSEAGYPATFVGKITGETRESCKDGSLQDVWVANTCAPPGETPNLIAEPEKQSIEEHSPIAAPPPSEPEEQVAMVEAVPAYAAPPPDEEREERSPPPPPRPTENETRTPTLCGTAHGTATIKAPSTDLCRDEAIASLVGGHGPWTWSCSNITMTQIDPCSAPLALENGSEEPSVELTDEAFPSSPPPKETSRRASSSIPAERPKATPARPTQPPEELCGSAAEIMAYEAPTTNLCRAGIASDVTGNGPWMWTCTNNAGIVSSCSTLSLAPASTSPTPSASTRAEVVKIPTKDTVAKRVAEPPPPPPKPVCGDAANTPARKAPSSDLCEEGKASSVRGANPWRWTCRSGRQKVSCKAPKTLDGKCGSAQDKASTNAPKRNLCRSGKARVTENDGLWTWTCKGSHGGEDVLCTAPVKKEPIEQVERVVIPRETKAEQTSATTAETTPIPEAQEQPIGTIAHAVPPSSGETSTDSDKSSPSTEDQKPAATPTPKPETSTAASTNKKTPLVLPEEVSTMPFSPNVSHVEASAKVKLDQVAVAMKKAPESRISVVAYARQEGTTPRAARRLSLARALAVRDYLFSKGIAESRVDVHAEGSKDGAKTVDKVDIKANK